MIILQNHKYLIFSLRNIPIPYLDQLLDPGIVAFEDVCKREHSCQTKKVRWMLKVFERKHVTRNINCAK